MNDSKTGRILFSAILAGEVCVAADLICMLFHVQMRPAVFAAIFAAAAVILCLIRPLKNRMIISAALIVAAFFSAAGAGSFLLWKNLSEKAVYEDADNGKQKLFAGRNVMIFVPHQDDDMNLLGGVIEEFTSCGSTVRVVFSTSGDYSGLEETRMHESISYLASCGVPEEHVIFLGYGNEWANWTHIYDMPPEELAVSYSGKTAAFALPEHPAYHEGALYTRGNYLADLENVILEYKPDLIFCTDYDDHIDHRALSLLFDEAMGNVLKKTGDYHPLVLKGFAYYTSFLSYADFYSPNILSTQNPSGFEHPLYIYVYKWSQRIRIPVSAKLLSRSLYSSGMYRQMEYYSSQNLQEKAQSIINGDRVFWKRDTSSFLYQSRIHVSSGDGEKLNDFKLWDTDQITEIRHFPFDGTWVPDAGDADKTAVITLHAPADLSEIVLYDNPSGTDNVLQAEIVFDSGNTYTVSDIDMGGAPTSVSVNESNVSQFTVRILDTEGEKAGFCEIEAYHGREGNDFAWIKLMNENDDFVYDYYLDESGEEDFSLYAYGCSANPENCSISCSGDCSAECADGKIRVRCPPGGKGTVTVSDDEKGVSDTVVISNPVRFRTTVQKIEKFWQEINGTATGRILLKIRDLI